MKTNRDSNGTRRSPRSSSEAVAQPKKPCPLARHCGHVRCRRARTCRRAGAYGDCLGVPGLRASIHLRLAALAGRLLEARAGV